LIGFVVLLRCARVSGSHSTEYSGRVIVNQFVPECECGKGAPAAAMLPQERAGAGLGGRRSIDRYASRLLKNAFHAFFNVGKRKAWLSL
jgi:hypothetical protein